MDKSHEVRVPLGTRHSISVPARMASSSSVVVWNHPLVVWTPPSVKELKAQLEQQRHVRAATAYRELLRAQLGRGNLLFE